MERDGEAVRLVADALDQVESFASARQHHRLVFVRHEQLFEALRQADRRYVVHAEFAHYLHSRAQLSLPAVDDDEVGEGPAFGFAIHDCRRRFLTDSQIFLAFRDLRVLCASVADLLAVVLEAPPQHLSHRCEVVRADDRLDLEAPVLARFWLAIDKDDHAGDRVCALDVRVVVALDAVRDVGQRQFFHELLKGEFCLVRVGHPLHSH